MIYYGFHILGFIASLFYLYWVFPKYQVNRFRGLGLAACTYLTAYALMLVLFWLITGSFGGQNVIRIFLFLPLILWLYANTFGLHIGPRELPGYVPWTVLRLPVSGCPIRGPLAAAARDSGQTTPREMGVT